MTDLLNQIAEAKASYDIQVVRDTAIEVDGKPHFNAVQRNMLIDGKESNDLLFDTGASVTVAVVWKDASMPSGYGTIIRVEPKKAVACAVATMPSGYAGAPVVTLPSGYLDEGKLKKALRKVASREVKEGVLTGLPLVDLGSSYPLPQLRTGKDHFFLAMVNKEDVSSLSEADGGKLFEVDLAASVAIVDHAPARQSAMGACFHLGVQVKALSEKALTTVTL